MIEAHLSGAILDIDLAALVRNWRRFAQMGTAAACVKADAYGLGAVPVAKALWQAGCRSFFVAFPEEGMKLRAALPKDVEIFILMGLLPGCAAEYEAHRLTPILAQGAELAEWRAHCVKVAQKLPAGVHFDTGIHRLGFSEAELRKIAPEAFADFNLTLVMSHLANADAPQDEMNKQQLARFHELRALLPACRSSLANSPGGLIGPEFALDLLRPGLGLYGASPQGLENHDFEIVARLKAPVLQVSDVAAGERIGYSGSYQTTKAQRIGVIGAGYADGFSRALSSGPEGPRARVMFADGPAPVVGRVSMDMITIDLTHLPQVVRGTMAELMGEAIRVEEIARLSGTIAYEVLTRLGSRYARVYSNGDSTS